MSDAGRKNFSDKIQEAVTPQDQKSYGQQAKETVTDGIDKIQRNLQPDETKSSTQQLGDSIQSGHDEGKRAASDNGKGLGDTAHEYLNSAKKTLNDAAEYVSGAITGGAEGASKGAGKGASAASK
jgi:predicted ribosome quality control (RQC) complex YloA/Tae2 family protein